MSSFNYLLKPFTNKGSVILKKDVILNIAIINNVFLFCDTAHVKETLLRINKISSSNFMLKPFIERGSVAFKKDVIFSCLRFLKLS